MRKAMHAGAVAAALFAIGCEPASRTPGGAPGSAGTARAPRVGALLERFQEGVTLLEEYEYVKAARVFEAVARDAPDWAPPLVNFGIALINLQKPEELERAEGALRRALAIDPASLPARFNLALLLYHIRRFDEAIDLFESVRKEDPYDAHTEYFLGHTCEEMGKKEEAIAHYERSLAIQPAMASAAYRLAQVLRADPNAADRVKQLLDLFTRFHDERSGEMAGKKYSETGPYGMAVRATGEPAPPESGSAPSFVVFPISAMMDAVAPIAPSIPARVGLAAGDVDGDGDVDLIAIGVGEPTLFRSDRGVLRPEPLPVAPREAVSKLIGKAVAIDLGDEDNDGDLDLAAVGPGVEHVFSNDGKGTFSPAEIRGIQPGGGIPWKAIWEDADRDDDLDLIVIAAPEDPAQGKTLLRVWNNNRDGTYREIAAEGKIGELAPDATEVLISDLDGDGDGDILVFTKAGPVEVLRNDRLWRWVRAPVEGIDAPGVATALAGDVDRDGRDEIVAIAPERTVLLLNDGRFRFRPDPAFARLAGRGTTGAIADVDADGDLDVLIADRAREPSAGAQLLLNDGVGRFADRTGVAGLDGVEAGADPTAVSADFDGDGGPDMVLFSRDRAARILRSVRPGGRHWIGIDLEGVQDPPKRWSNRSGAGARVEVFSGDLWLARTLDAHAGLLARGPLRLLFGLGERERVDCVRVVWPDRILQAEFGFPVDRVVKIIEEQRKPSSCPVLFAWTGAGLSYVADCLGVGGVGFWVAPETYARPDPTEALPLPRLAPRDGKYEIRLIEHMQEVAYLDRIALRIVDAPAGVTVLPEEYFAAQGSAPRPRLFAFRERLFPARAEVEARGARRDVRDRLLSIDRRYAGGFEIDRRFIGFAEPHALEIAFDQDLGGAPWVLCLHGWVEYGYSRTLFAAHQAGIAMRAPTIAVERGGKWMTVLEEIGYPAGLEHAMTVDLAPHLAPGDRRIRISTNMEIYWDAVYLARDEGEKDLAVREIDASEAALEAGGYPREFRPDGEEPPLFDANVRVRTLQWLRPAGAYTRLGDVTDLVRRTDDRFVIFGPGEEVVARFPADLPPPAAGRERHFIAWLDGYCKDMDLYTAHPETIEPLPHHGARDYPPEVPYPGDGAHAAYRAQYNTRWMGEAR